MVRRLAVWSSPRNISTALLRAWENRPDTIVCDEPLYAYYLKRTGLPHPGADEIIAHHENDWRKVAAWLTGPVPEGASVFYQKHMAHHLLDEVERSWIAELENAFLIRDPREMLLSLDQVTPDPGPLDTGLPQLLELFEAERARTGRVPAVLDARDVLTNPRGVLAAFCERVGVPFREEMLAWPAGPRDTDGIWAKHWYAAVERSTAFEPWRPRAGALRPALEPVLAAVRPAYEALHLHRISA